MFVNNDSNPVALSISLAKALLKLVGFAPAAAMIEGGQDLYQLLTDISNGSLGDPNAEMIRSLNSVMHLEINRIEADLKNNGVDRTQVKQTLTTLLDATKSTIKNLSTDESKLLEAIRNPDSFADLVKHEAVALPKDSDENTQNFYERLLEVVAAEFLTLTPGSPNFNRVALVDLIRCFPDWRDRIDRLEQNMNKRFDKVDEDNQEIIGLLREQSSSTGRLIFGSRPDVVAGERFVERDEQKHLNELIVDPTIQRTVLVGMRGCGKTQLAVSLAEQCEDANWNLVAWINAVSRESIENDLVELAKQLQIDTSDLDNQEQIVRRCLGHLRNAPAADRLIVFDNVENIDDLLGLVPRCKGLRVVVTTTNKAGWEDQGWNRVKVGVFEREKSIDYLLKVTKSDDRDVADALAERLGCLPLAIAQAAATAHNEHWTLQYYFKRLEEYDLARVIHPVRGDSYTQGVASALALAVDTTIKHLVRGTPRTARRQLGALAILAESGIPTRWLDPLTDPRNEAELLEADRDVANDAHLTLAELIDRSLVQQTTDKRATMLHRLQAQAFRESWTAPERTEAFKSAAVLLGSVDIDRFRADDSDARFQETRDLIEQLRAFGAQDCFHCLRDYRPVTSALCEAFTHARDLGLVPEVFALKEFVDTLLDLQVVDALDILSLRSHLAYAYLHAGRSANAIERYEKVLSSSKHALGPIHRVTLTIQNDLAYAYYWANRTDEAIDLFEQVLDERTRILSSDHEDTLMTGSYLALAYADDGQLERAITLGEQVVKDRDRVLKPDHKYTLVTRNNLADAYKSVGRLTDAIKMYEYVLQARIRTLGNTHHHTRITRNDLAQTYEQAGDLPKAISMYEDLHNDHIRIYGPDHEKTIEVRDRLEAAKRELEQREEDSAAE